MRTVHNSDDEIERLFDMTTEQLAQLIHNDDTPDQATYQYMPHRTHWLAKLSEGFFAWLSRHLHQHLIATGFRLIHYTEDRTATLTKHANERISSKAVSPSQWLKRKPAYRLPEQRGIVLGSPYTAAPILLPHFRTTTATWPDITSDVVTKMKQEAIAV